MRKDFLTLNDFSQKDIRDILDLASDMKEKPSTYRSVLPDKVLAMVFQKPSTRTRVSFEVAMAGMGGHAIYLGWDQLQLGRGETIEDTGRVLSRYVHGIMARVFDHRDLERLAASSTVPVINGLSDLYHPAQVLSDLLTIREKRGRLEGVSLAYIGDGNNVCNSLLLGTTKVGVDISVASPPGFAPRKNIVEMAKQNADQSGSRITIMEEPRKAALGVDIIYTDVFVSMGMEKERERRLRAFLPRYRVDADLMDIAGEGSLFMHCLPAHRGEEVSGSVIDGEQSVVWDQAENRLHTQKALLYTLLRNGA
ncbi:MAG: ornithine carbamoyltransferase [Candidatus Geothermarchaeales archaeon]